MGLFDLFKKKKVQVTIQTPEKHTEPTAPTSAKSPVRNLPDSYADSSTIAPDERPFYQPDSYYTYYS